MIRGAKFFNKRWVPTCLIIHFIEYPRLGRKSKVLGLNMINYIKEKGKFSTFHTIQIPNKSYDDK